mgnify:FL=1
MDSCAKRTEQYRETRGNQVNNHNINNKTNEETDLIIALHAHGLDLNVCPDRIAK